MRIKQLRLKNFRSFRDISIKIPNSNVVAIIGMNGSGKTTLLDAVALCMTHFTGELLSKNESYNIDSWFLEDDITNNEESGEIEVKFEFSKYISQNYFNDQNLEKSIKVSKSRDEIGLKFDKNPIGFLKQFKEYLKSETIKSIPIISYFGVNRTVMGGNSNTKESKTYNSKLMAYDHALRLNAPSFYQFETWFIDQINEENAMKVSKADLKYELPSLSTIRKALIIFLNSIANSVFSNLSTLRESETDPGFNQKSTQYLSISKDSHEFKFSQLSYGERMVISLVCEISRRLTLANENISDSLKGDGIVLIDELDLHLHPSWQRRIVHALTTTFPNVQFILASHSPLILSGIRRENIMLLGKNEILDNTELPDIYTATSDEILEKLLLSKNNINTYSEDRKKVDKLFNAMKFAEAEQELNVLINKINSSPKWLLDYKQRLDFVKNDFNK